MKYIKKFCLILAVIAILGFGAGKFWGDRIMLSSIRGDISLLTFIFSPSQSFIDTFSLLNNSSDYKRLSGYYAYNNYGLIDSDFLYERYKIEDSDIIRKTIIWIAEENMKEEKLVDFYKKIYNISPENIKKILMVKIGK